MNVAITNRIIKSLQSEWASFRGFSLLFNNPVNNLPVNQNKLIKIDCKVAESSELDLYKALSAAVTLVENSTWKEQYLFCPLPDYSYHVTVWDGLNDINHALLSSLDYSAYREFLENLPYSLLTSNKFLEIVASSLMLKKNLSIKFRTSYLEIVQNDGLVACLIPADASSETELKHIIELRKDVYDDYNRYFGIDLSYTYKPHITLGYFANGELAELAKQELTSWNTITARATNGLTIVFKSISLYGFSGMISFYKKK